MNMLQNNSHRKDSDFLKISSPHLTIQTLTNVILLNPTTVIQMLAVPIRKDLTTALATVDTKEMELTAQVQLNILVFLLLRFLSIIIDSP